MFPALKSIFRWWDLILALALKEIRVRYKQRYLRALWAVINPIFTMIVLTFIFSRVVKVSSEGLPYPIFNFTALVPWSFFAACLTSSCTCLMSNYNLITRLRFPRITIPISAILANSLDFAVSMAILSILFVIYHVSIGPNIIYIIPIFLIQLLLTFGLGLIFSISNVYLRDIQNALPKIIQAWMLVSPVVYSLNMVGEKYRFFYLLNPMAAILDSYRKVLLHNQSPNFYYLGISFLISTAIFIFGYWFFKRNEHNLADII